MTDPGPGSIAHDARVTIRLAEAPTPAAAVLALVLLAAESALLVAASRGWTLEIVLATHVLLSAAAGFWMCHPRRRPTRYAILLCVATAAFGPLGPPGVLLTMVLERYHARAATGLEEWHAMLFPRAQPHDHQELWRRIGQRASDRPAEHQVTPFLDVLAFGSVPQRQAVIAIIAQQFHPAFALALRAALRDEHNVVRVQAATAIARLENQFLERTMELEAAVRETPDDPDLILALASHYDDQAFAGLLDSRREQDCRVKAHEGYERYLRLRPKDPPVEFRLARLQLRRGLAVDAAPRFRSLVDAGHPGAGLWLMESLFAQRRFHELREAASAPGGLAASMMTPEVSATLELWSSMRETA